MQIRGRNIYTIVLSSLSKPHEHNSKKEQNLRLSSTYMSINSKNNKKSTDSKRKYLPGPAAAH